MNDTSVPQQFKLGLLALHNQLVTEATLISAFETWWSDRSRQFGEILVEQGAISDESHQELIRLVGAPHSIESRNSTISEFESGRAGAMDDASIPTELLVPGRDVSMATLKWGDNNPQNAEKRTSQDRYRMADNHRFRILRQHARSGLGIVYVAEDQQLHRPVALKQIREDRDNSDWSRNKFIQEAEITGQLEHPGIVPIYALGVDPNGKPYYAMRFIQGNDLSSRIREFHRDRAATKEAFDGPNLKHLLRRFLDVCNSMEYAHSRGVLHRDLKPANVMLGEFGETLVVDWGLAKLLPGFAKGGSVEELPMALKQVIATDQESSGSETLQGQFMGTSKHGSMTNPAERMLKQHYRKPSGGYVTIRFSSSCSFQ
jgi:eukaryotic-like serine/threonine-protein kinase